MSDHHLWRIAFKCFLEPLRFEKNFEDIPTLVMTGHYLKHYYVLLQFLYATPSQ